MLNQLDREITDIMIHAEKKCCNVSSHHLDHRSPELIAALRNKRHWRTELTKAAKSPFKVRFVQAIETFSYVDMKLKEAEAEYNDLAKQSRKIHEEFLLDRARVLAIEKKTKPEKEVKRLIHIEKQRDQSCRMNSITKPIHGGGPNTVLIPAITEYPQPRIQHFDHYNIDQIWTRIDMFNGEDIHNWERITDRSKVEKMLLQWQRKYFKQSNTTPFATNDWHLKLQDYHIQQAILDGTYPIPEDLPLEARELLIIMRRPPQLDSEIQDFTTLKDFREYIKKIDEKTSSSPSTRHYGHYKTLYSTDEKYLKSLQSQTVLDRWEKTVTALIENKIGRPLIHRFRVIHVIEGDLQFLSRFFYAYTMMHKAESLNLITDQQYGGRRRRRMAQSVLLNKVCYYNICHQTLTEAVFIDDDARACYDRIFTSLSSAECRRWGMPYKVTQFTNKFIENQDFHIRTAYGISKNSYSFDSHHPIQGSGQGVSWAGPRWTNTSDTICSIMKDTCTGMCFVDPTREIVIEKNADLFVDDTATGTTKSNIHDGKSALHHLQRDEQKHAFLLYATGHFLALFKCVFYWFGFKRVRTKYIHTTIEDMPGDLEIRASFNGPIERIRRLQPYEPHTSLGCELCVDQNQVPQLEEVKKIINTWVRRIQSSHLSNYDKLHAYKTCLEKKTHLHPCRYIIDIQTMPRP